jgi:hypothetical protein
VPDDAAELPTISTDDLWSAAALEEAQKADVEVRPVYEATSKSSDKPSSKETSLWPRESKILWHQWPRLRIINGILYRKW